MPVQRDRVRGHWIHSREEDTDSEMVFRPAGADLPPARGRMGFELRADGTFAETGLGASDLPEQATGRWALDGDLITLSEGAAQGVPREMEVVSVDDARLVIRTLRRGN